MSGDDIKWIRNDAEERFEHCEDIRYKCFNCLREFLTCHLSNPVLCPFCGDERWLSKLDDGKPGVTLV
jgi:DNA-directed RNA polymerase subunit RPC12/RpoP